MRKKIWPLRFAKDWPYFFEGVKLLNDRTRTRKASIHSFSVDYAHKSHFAGKTAITYHFMSLRADKLLQFVFVRYAKHYILKNSGVNAGNLYVRKITGIKYYYSAYQQKNGRIFTH